MTETATLRRRLTLPLVILYGLGSILGAGIYVLVGKVAGMAGIYAPLSFLVASLIATLTAFSYADLASRYPSSAGEAKYVMQAFGSPLLSMLVGWSVVLIGVISAATLSRGFAGYMQVFVALDDWLIITLLVLAFFILSVWGILESVGVAALITLVELLGLLLVILLNVEAFGRSPELFSQWTNLDIPGVWNGILLGSVLAFYAYLGFEDIVNIAEEVQHAERNIPRAILWSLLGSALLYLLVSMIAVLVMPLDQLAVSKAPLADMLSRYDWSRTTITLISMLAITNGILIQIIMASRVIYGMAAQDSAPAYFSGIHPLTHTPVRATLLASMLVLGFALWLPLVTLAQITSMVTLFVFALINAALLRVNLGQRGMRRFRFRGFLLPALGALSCVSLMFYQLLLGF
jgi:basic amino acid/polyamine antiporter, APA family